MRDGQDTQVWWRTTLDGQRRVGFQDLAGSEGTVQLTLTDALLNRVIAALLPAAWPVSELTVHALDHNEIAARVRPRTAWLPPLQARVAVEQTPATPAAPLLRARFTSATGRVAGIALGSASMPGWLHVSKDYLAIDVAELARQFGVDDLLPLLNKLTLGAQHGRVILTCAVAVG